MPAYEATLSHMLADAEFVIDQRGQTKGVFLPLTAWETMLAVLEDAEDLAVAKDFLTRRAMARSPEEMGLLRWENVATDWNSRPGASPDATLQPQVNQRNSCNLWLITP